MAAWVLRRKHDDKCGGIKHHEYTQRLHTTIGIRYIIARKILNLYETRVVQDEREPTAQQRTPKQQ